MSRGFFTNSVFPILLALLVSTSALSAPGRKRHAPAGGRRAVVVDERLSALRDEPRLEAHLVQRLGRGRMVSIIGARRAPDGINFYHVAVTRRTRGWLQAESVVSPARTGDDARLLRLIKASEGFELIARARIFLDLFPRSPLRPAVLLLYSDTAEEAADKLSRDAARRFDEREMTPGDAPTYSYYLNYNGLDRFNRQGVGFIYDRRAKQFHYDGAGWREIVRRYPHTPEAEQARAKLNSLSAIVANQGSSY